MKDNNQPDLPIQPEGEAYARNTDPTTSHIAAGDAEGKRASHLESIVLALLSKYREGLTTHEIAEKSGVCWGSITPRIRPLIKRGLVLNSGMKRPSPYGKPCIVWIAA